MMSRLSCSLTMIGWLLLFLSNSVSAVDEIVLDTEVDYQTLKNHLLERYQPLVEQFATAESAQLKTIGPLPVKIEGAEAGADPYRAWWSEQATAPLSGLSSVSEEDIAALFQRALAHSSQIKVFSDLPLIRRTTIQEAEGEFDVRGFADGRYSDIDEPVGDELKTGGPERYLEDSNRLDVGVRKNFSPGTEVELAQRFGSFDSNSTFLNPIEQGTSRTGLAITQPLLKGFGPRYNKTPIELAKVDFDGSSAELRRQLEGHLLEIARAYWGLYVERSIFLQKQRLAETTEEIYTKMEQRAEIDVQPSLLARARSQLLAHQLDADEARFAIFNAQSRIWALVNDAELVEANGIELITRQNPHHTLPQESMAIILAEALQNRPEVDQSILQIQSAVLRYHRSKNELLPDLDLYFETYVKGLEGDYDHSGAWDESWNEGDPSYHFGLHFEFPFGNNSAEGREVRKRLEIRQLLHQLDTAVSNILLEAQVSYREMLKSHMALERRFQVMQATEQEIDALLQRIDIMLTQNQDYGTILYQLLDAMERLNEAEIDFSASELTYNLSLYQLERAQGVLLSKKDIAIEEVKDDGLPRYLISVKTQ
ncbi:MAG: TolC family protein [Desulfofustis sp.]|nr:TolC family protein [Desulfofustis sp.]